MNQLGAVAFQRFLLPRCTCTCSSRNPLKAAAVAAAAAISHPRALSTYNINTTLPTQRSIRPRPRHRQQSRCLHRIQRFKGTAALPTPSRSFSFSSSARQPTQETDDTVGQAEEESAEEDFSIGPALLYEQRCRAGLLRKDEHQLVIIQQLEKLYRAVLKYRPPPVPEPLAELGTSSRFGLMSRLFGVGNNPEPSIPEIPDDVPRSVYLFGDVGCGKSMLMDLLYETLPETLGKRRVHFHAFMIDVHKRLHRIAESGAHQKGDAIVPVARELAKEGRILCFDEFQVTDIADAMILRRLLESLIGYGYVIIITSNRQPDDLYKNGIQRSSFIPCIELIKARFDVTDLDSPTDYRKLPRALSKVYYHPRNDANVREFDKLFNGLSKSEEAPIRENTSIEVWGRQLNIPQSSADGKVARFSFAQLCGQPLSAADYLEVVRNFDTVFIDDIPRLSLSERDQARRFILFIDAAYESKTKLFTLSHVPITQIFSDKPGQSASSEISAHQRAMMDDLGLNAETVGASSIFTGDEEVFAFARAVSRLTEMGTKNWAERVRSS